MTRTVISIICAALILMSVSCSGKSENILIPGSTADNPDTAVTTGRENTKLSLTSNTAGEVLDYFAEIAFGSEYGDSSDRLCRWEDEIICKLSGNYTDSDKELIRFLFDTLNGIVGFPGIRYNVNGEPFNFEVMFVPRDKIVELFDDADEYCVGMSEYHWYTDSCQIFRARAAIDCDETSERASTICEEILQSMGLAMDSYSHPDSVFYQGTCYYSRPSELDFSLVKLLYSPALKAGMDKTSAITAAAGLLSWD